MSARKEPTPAGDIPCHPLFVSTLDTKGPLSRPIETIDVERMKGSGPKRRYVFVDWRNATELPDERALLEVFGPGKYKLTGKNLERNCFVRSALLDIESEDVDDDDDDRPAAASPAPAAPVQDSMVGLLMQMLIADKKDASLRHERDMERMQRHSETLLQTVTTFASAAMNMKGAAASGGMKEALELTRHMREAEEEALAKAQAQREIIEEEVTARTKASGGTDGDIVDSFMKPIMEKVGEKAAGKIVENPS